MSPVSPPHPPRLLGRAHPTRPQLGRARPARLISHQGSADLRWGLIKAAQTAVQADGPLKTSYQRIKHRGGSKVAKVAVAREILTLCYCGLRDGEIRCLEAAAARANSALAMAPSNGPIG
jgi:hypothetical protein